MMNARSAALIFLVAIVPVFIQAQDPEQSEKRPAQQAAGFGITDAELIDQMMRIVPGIGKTSREMLNAQSIKPYMMPVRQVSYRDAELSYALAICLEYYVNLNKNYKINLSPDYISLNLRNDGRAVNALEAFRFLADNGTVSAAILPYDAEALTSAVYATPKFRINNYLILFREVTRGQQKVYETRKALLRGHPVLVKFQAKEGLVNALGEQTLRLKGDGGAAHPLVVVGFDEQREAFELLSCWGSKWGEGGYAWVSYKDFEDFARSGFVMVPLENY